MKQYLMSVHHLEGEEMPPPEEFEQIFAAVDAVNAELQAAGAWVFGGGLVAPDATTRVRVTGDDVAISDGPYPEAKEHLGGFWIINAEDDAAAQAWAVKAARACRNLVQLRAFQDDPA